MEIVKVISISILLICYIGNANAQNGTDPSGQPTTANQAVSKSTIITCGLMTDPQVTVADLKRVLNNEITRDNTVKIIIDSTTLMVSLSVDTAKVKLSEIENRLYDKYILLYPEDKSAEQAVETILQPLAEKYNPEIDKFLNIEDTSIFTSAFKSCNLQEVHPSRRSFYQVVEKIHDFSEKLQIVEQTLSNSKIDDVAKQMNLPKETIKGILVITAKENIDKAEQDLDGLIPFIKEIDYLSPPQKQYYKLLKDKFNDLYSHFIPNDQ
jgi:hypothetical protein